MEIWYAVLRDNEDNDWGTGSLDLNEAKQMAKNQLDDYPDTLIAVIEVNEGDDNSVCVDEIREFD